MIDQTEIARMYFDAVKNNTIEAKILLRIPELLTCQDWNAVDFIGYVDYISEIKKCRYKGMLCHFNDGLYYVKQAVIDAIKVYDKRLKKNYPTIKVI